MKTMRILLVGLLAFGALAASDAALAWHGGPRVVLGFNFGLPLYDPYYYYGPPVYYAPPPVMYLPAPMPAPPSQVFYQYYCPATNAYYPAVPTCSQPWLRVVPDGSVH